MAPDGFGQFGGDLLIGNFGDGTINAFEPVSGGDFDFAGTLHRRNGNVMAINGLWALQFGNGRRRADGLAVLHRRSQRREPRLVRDDRAKT